MNQKLRVGIRGISGLLGTRLAEKIQQEPDMEVSFGTAINDQTLERFFARSEYLVKMDRPPLAPLLLIAGKHKEVRGLNAPGRACEPLDQYSIYKLCDVLIDATGPGVSVKFQNDDLESGIPVILQSGEYPRGRLIAPPAIQNGQSKLYRQGDCVLSGIAPIVAALQCGEFGIESVTASVLMQYSSQLHDYPTSQRICATYLRRDIASEVKMELGFLFPNTTFQVNPVLQVPGLDYYTVTLNVQTRTPVRGNELMEVLAKSQRTFMSGDDISSTYQIDHYLRESIAGSELPPIGIYSKFVEPKGSWPATSLVICASLYSRFMAVLPNIEAVRMVTA
jgi:glyceraldehyde-3-phosphate dehydrogenase/erythrose-4-phosphate dehydrogenase